MKEDLFHMKQDLFHVKQELFHMKQELFHVIQALFWGPFNFPLSHRRPISIHFDTDFCYYSTTLTVQIYESSRTKIVPFGCDPKA